MKRVVIAIVAVSLVLFGSLAVLAAPAQARFGYRPEGDPENWGGAWNTAQPHILNCYGVDADLYPWHQQPNVYVSSDLGCTWEFEWAWGVPRGVGSFLSAGFTQWYWYDFPPQRYVRWRTLPFSESLPGSEYKGPVDWYTWQEFTILRMGSEWWVLINGGLEFRIPVSYSKCSVKADCSTYTTVGGARSYFWNVREMNDFWHWEDSNLIADGPSRILSTVVGGNTVYTFRL